MIEVRGDMTLPNYNQNSGCDNDDSKYLCGRPKGRKENNSWTKIQVQCVQVLTNLYFPACFQIATSEMLSNYNSHLLPNYNSPNDTELRYNCLLPNHNSQFASCREIPQMPPIHASQHVSSLYSPTCFQAMVSDLLRKLISKTSHM